MDNPIGSAVGFEMTLGNCRVICTPGVPGELAAMLDGIVADLAQQLQRPVERNILRLQTFGLGESTAQQMISDALPDWPAEVDLGFRAGAPQMEIKLTIDSAAPPPRSSAAASNWSSCSAITSSARAIPCWRSACCSCCASAGQTLTTAESCTGGLIASMLTRIPGSSDGFHAGFVTYANDIKHAVLGVSEQTLSEHGAVSEEVVLQMARGAMERSGADYAIAVSGIAGPDGGTRKNRWAPCGWPGEIASTFAPAACAGRWSAACSRP